MSGRIINPYDLAGDLGFIGATGPSGSGGIKIYGAGQSPEVFTNKLKLIWSPSLVDIVWWFDPSFGLTIADGGILTWDSREVDFIMDHVSANKPVYTVRNGFPCVSMNVGGGARMYSTEVIEGIVSTPFVTAIAFETINLGSSEKFLISNGGGNTRDVWIQDAIPGITINNGSTMTGESPVVNNQIHVLAIFWVGQNDTYIFFDGTLYHNTPSPAGIRPPKYVSIGDLYTGGQGSKPFVYEAFEFGNADMGNFLFATKYLMNKFV